MTNYENLKNSDFEDFLKILRKVTVFRCEYCEARYSDYNECNTKCEEKFAEWLESGVEE